MNKIIMGILLISIQATSACSYEAPPPDYDNYYVLDIYNYKTEAKVSFNLSRQLHPCGPYMIFEDAGDNNLLIETTKGGIDVIDLTNIENDGIKIIKTYPSPSEIELNHQSQRIEFNRGYYNGSIYTPKIIENQLLYKFLYQELNLETSEIINLEVKAYHLAELFGSYTRDGYILRKEIQHNNLTVENKITVYNYGFTMNENIILSSITYFNETGYSLDTFDEKETLSLQSFHVFIRYDIDSKKSETNTIMHSNYSLIRDTQLSDNGDYFAYTYWEVGNDIRNTLNIFKWDTLEKVNISKNYADLSDLSVRISQHSNELWVSYYMKINGTNILNQSSINMMTGEVILRNVPRLGLIYDNYIVSLSYNVRSTLNPLLLEISQQLNINYSFIIPFFIIFSLTIIFVLRKIIKKYRV